MNGAEIIATMSELFPLPLQLQTSIPQEAWPS